MTAVTYEPVIPSPHADELLIAIGASRTVIVVSEITTTTQVANALRIIADRLDSQAQETPMTERQPTIEAQPYEARQCPICKLWIYTADGPFAENDRTKTQADYYHWEAAHATAEQLNSTAIGFPYFPWNTEPVTAMVRS